MGGTLLTTFVTLLVCGMGTAQAPPQRQLDAEQQRLLGRWELVSVDAADSRRPRRYYAGATCTFYRTWVEAFWWPYGADYHVFAEDGVRHLYCVPATFGSQFPQAFAYVLRGNTLFIASSQHLIEQRLSNSRFRCRKGFIMELRRALD
jgi:hypothetical protein